MRSRLEEERLARAHLEAQVALLLGRLGVASTEQVAAAATMDLAQECEEEEATEVALREAARTRESESEHEAKLCVVCLAEPKSHVFPACMHKCVCAGCAFELEATAGGGQGGIECPLCRVPSRSVHFVFE